jgi:hypothetical protein
MRIDGRLQDEKLCYKQCKDQRVACIPVYLLSRKAVVS